jgi:hypothetical protein
MALNRTSTNNFGISQYIVSTDPTASSSTDLQYCFDQVVAAGGGTIYVQPGTYTLNGTFNTGGVSMTIIGASSDTVEVGSPIPISTVVISGNQSISGTGSITFQNLSFSATSGTTISVVSGGTSSLAFVNCSLSNSGGAGVSFVGASLASYLKFDNSNIFASTTAVTTTNCSGTFTNTGFYGGTGAGLSIGATCQITGITNIYTSTSSHALIISAASGELISSYSAYTATAVGVSCVNFTAAGILVTVNDSFLSNASSGFYATTTNASAGDILIGNSTIQGTATAINPTLLTTYYLSSINVTAGSNSWNAITANQSLVADNSYVVTSGALSLALPTTAAFGTEIVVSLYNTGTSWVITQAAGQRIQFGSSATTTGTGGNLASTAAGDTVKLVCVIANTAWLVIYTIGNIKTV